MKHSISHALKDSPRRSVYIFAAVVLGAVLVHQVAGATDESGTVVVDQNIQISTTQGPARSVSITYEFPEHNRIYIFGFGDMPSRGTVTFLTFASSISFAANPSGPPLRVVDLSDSIELMGPSTLEIPSIQQFPAASRQGLWSRVDWSFAHAIRRTLEKTRFRSGVVAMEIEGKSTLLTPFADLPKTQNKTFARIALLISHTVPEKEKGIPFQVRFLVQERRSHTSWRSEVDDRTRRAAEEFIDVLLRELEEE